MCPCFRFTSISYALMGEEILSKERDIQCSVRSDLSEKMNMLSLVVAIGIPLVIGPILCPLGHILLSVCACMKDVVTANTPQGHQHESNDPKSTVLDCGLIFGFILVSKTCKTGSIISCWPPNLKKELLYFSGIPHFLPNSYVRCRGLSRQHQDPVCLYVF